MSPRLRVGWIGTGLMGLPMARHVLSAGHALTVFSRTAGRATPLLDAGAAEAHTIADVSRDADVVVTIVSAPPDVAEIYEGPDGLLAHAAPGTVAIDMTTSDPSLARRLAVAGEAVGVRVLDAPVSGGPTGAEAGTLSTMVGGDAEALADVRPLLETFSETIVHHGDAGNGQLAKLANQTLVAGTTLAVCEAFALARATGLDLELVRRSLAPGVAGSPLLDFIWARLRAGDLEPGFTIDHLDKDLALAASASDGGASLPGVSLVTELIGEVRQRRGGGRGTQSLVTALVEWP